MKETWIRSLGQEDPLEEEMATRSSQEEMRNPVDRGAWRATAHDWEAKHACMHARTMMYFRSKAALLQSPWLLQDNPQRRLLVPSSPSSGENAK